MNSIEREKEIVFKGQSEKEDEEEDENYNSPSLLLPAYRVKVPGMKETEEKGREEHPTEEEKKKGNKREQGM
jgi:hypothetical protein